MGTRQVLDWLFVYMKLNLQDLVYLGQIVNTVWGSPIMQDCRLLILVNYYGLCPTNCTEISSGATNLNFMHVHVPHVGLFNYNCLSSIMYI